MHSHFPTVWFGDVRRGWEGFGRQAVGYVGLWVLIMRKWWEFRRRKLGMREAFSGIDRDHPLSCGRNGMMPASIRFTGTIIPCLSHIEYQMIFWVRHQNQEDVFVFSFP
jgi:hypothetical protein